MKKRRYQTEWPEAESQARLKVEAGKRGVPLFRINTGAFYNQAGRLVRFGEEGWPDYFGLLPRAITPEDMDKTIGQFVAIETKPSTFAGPKRPREHKQSAFLQQITQYGGLAAFSRGEWPFL